MNDRELLEFAAEAAHIGLMWFGNVAILRGPIENEWNPLTDDGDALRLAVKLGMRTDYCAFVVAANILDDHGCYVREVSIKYSEQEGYRRAIVRAAAEIGKAMQ